MRRRVAAIFASVTVCATLSATAATTAHAQLGMIKKMATDKAKEAAGMKEPEGAQKSGGAKVDYTITTERLTAVIASLQPYVESAKAKVAGEKAEKAMKGEYDAFQASRKTVVDCASKAASVGALPDFSWTQSPQGEAGQARMASVMERLPKVDMQKNPRLWVGLQDTAQVLQIQSMSMMYPRAKCGAPPYMSKALIDYNAGNIARDAKAGNASGEMPREDGSVVIPPANRGGMTPAQFGRIRELFAIWMMMKSGDLPPNAYKFTDAEKAVLTKMEEQAKDFGPLFKVQALNWASWGDIKTW